MKKIIFISIFILLSFSLFSEAFFWEYDSNNDLITIWQVEDFMERFSVLMVQTDSMSILSLPVNSVKKNGNNYSVEMQNGIIHDFTFITSGVYKHIINNVPDRKRTEENVFVLHTDKILGLHISMLDYLMKNSMSR